MSQSNSSEHAHKSGFETRAIHAGYEPDPSTGAVIPPIYATSTYKQDGVGGLRGGYEYSRSANPTRTALEGALAAVEEGERAFAFASGLAAEDTLVRALCRPGDHVVLPDDAYGGTFRLFDKVESSWGLEHSPAAGSDLDAVRAAIQPGRTKLVWMETPTNPLLNIGDIEALAAVAHEAGARLVVDNTFASPYLQQPLTLGADVVVHSTTKYVGGHSDVVGGALVVRDLEVAETIAFHQNSIGAVPGPFDSFLTHRGLKTLAVRMDRHCDNAERIVDFLTGHPAVAQVIYPGPARAPGARRGGQADEALRRHGELPGGGRRAGRAGPLRPHRGVHLGRVAGRRRVADRAPRPDDARQRRGHRSRGAGRPGPAQRRDRDGRGPAGRPRPRPGLTQADQGPG